MAHRDLRFGVRGSSTFVVYDLDIGLMFSVVRVSQSGVSSFCYRFLGFGV